MFNTYKNVKYRNSYSGEHYENFEDHDGRDQNFKMNKNNIIFEDI
jgi:hypothetical protein